MARSRGYGMTMDEDIAHVARVMVPSLSAFRGEPVLQPAYWRRRLQRIQSEFRLTETQTLQIQHLLGDLDRFEAESLAKKQPTDTHIRSLGPLTQCGDETSELTRYVQRLTTTD